MRNLVIFDENLIKRFTNIPEDKKIGDFQIVFTNDLSSEIDFKKFDKLVFLVFEELYFASEAFLSFFKSNAKKMEDLSVNIFVFKEKNTDKSLTKNWFSAVADDYNLNINLTDVILDKNFDRNLKVVFDKINQSLDGSNQLQTVLKPEIQKSNHVTIYTDGACSGNPGAGGWGAVLIHGERQKEISGFDEQTTNNRMEMTAVIEALSALKQKCMVDLYSDSAYVVNAINQKWLENWKSNNWIGADKKPVKNLELWQKLDELLTLHDVTFYKVKGHSDNVLNNRCDELATSEIAKHISSLN